MGLNTFYKGTMNENMPATEFEKRAMIALLAPGNLRGNSIWFPHIGLSVDVKGTKIFSFQDAPYSGEMRRQMCAILACCGGGTLTISSDYEEVEYPKQLVVPAIWDLYHADKNSFLADIQDRFVRLLNDGTITNDFPQSGVLASAADGKFAKMFPDFLSRFDHVGLRYQMDDFLNFVCGNENVFYWEKLVQLKDKYLPTFLSKHPEAKGITAFFAA